MPGVRQMGTVDKNKMAVACWHVLHIYLDSLSAWEKKSAQATAKTPVYYISPSHLCMIKFMRVRARWSTQDELT